MNKKKMINCLLTLILFFGIFIFLGVKITYAANEDFTTWTEVDPNSHLSQTTITANWTNMIRNEECYLYRNDSLTFGIVFTHLLEFQLSSIDVNTDSSDQYLALIWQVCEQGGRPFFVDVGDSIYLVILENGNSTTTFRLYLSHSDDIVQDTSSILNVGTTYYLNITRNDPLVNTTIYSDASRTTLVDSIQIDLTGEAEEGKTFDTAQTTGSHGSGLDPNDQSDGWVANLDFDPSLLTRVSSSPELNVDWELNGTAYTTPWTNNLTAGIYNFTCTELEVVINASFKYVFNYWDINGSQQSYAAYLPLSISGATNLTMYYLATWTTSPTTSPTFSHDALNGTWYMRSDTHTVHDVFAYRLASSQTQTASTDSRTISGTHNTSYGIRIWYYDLWNYSYELTSGVPTAIVTRSSNGSGIQSAIFNCPAVNTLIDAVQINVYQRFDSDAWSLRRYFITDNNIFIKMPANTWTVYYYTNRTVSSTTSRFSHGSLTANSRITLQYYRANPWEVALARLSQSNWLGFLFTPWTYWLGDVFWSILLLFGIVTSYNRWQSLKPILALLWILGGSGSFLSAMIPALALNIAWLMLAVAMGITLFKLIYR